MTRCGCGRRSITWCAACERERCRACAAGTTCDDCRQALIDTQHGGFFLLLIVFVLCCAVVWGLAMFL